MTTVRKMLESKEGFAVHTVNAGDTVYHALEVMAECNVGAVLVCDGERLVGIFTERDYARKVILKGRESKNTLVSELMTRELVTINLDTSVEQCAAIMTKYRVRHLPVVEDEKVIGIVSIRSIALQMIATRDSKIMELENYILGAGYGR